MSDDDQMKRLFDGLEFNNEPAMTSMASDDVRRGRRRLRNRRLTTWASGVAGAAVLATGAAVAMPGGGQAPTEGQNVASGGEPSGPPSAESSPTPDETSTAEPESGATSDRDPDMPYPETRQRLLDVAAEHFDAGGIHLPDSSTNTQSANSSSGVSAGTKLGWTVPDEPGLGMVQVAVTTPGFVDGDHALGNFAANIGCEIGSPACTEQELPGTGDTAFVSDGSTSQHQQFSIVHERADGSLVGVAVHDLFGNNSTTPVPSVDVALDEAAAFVADPDLRVRPDEAAQVPGPGGPTPNESDPAAPNDADFSSTENVPAPQSDDMSPSEAETVLGECVASAPDWADFQADFGVRADADAEPATSVGWVLAHDEGDRLACAVNSDGKVTGGVRFGDTQAKDMPHLTAPIVSKDPGFGMYTSDIARVTVQESGGPEQDAIMRDGYWFLPVDDNDTNAVALRGYDAEGDVVYDSTTDAPAQDACFTNPDGTEIVRSGPVSNPSLDDCLPTHAWDH